MPGQVANDHRLGGRHPIEIRRGEAAVIRDEAVVEAGPHYLRARFTLGGPGGEGGQNCIDRRTGVGSGIDVYRVHAQHSRVQVGFDKAGEHGGAGEIDNSGVGAS